MAEPVNKKYQNIITKGFGGDKGKESAYFRELFEILILERDVVKNNITLNQKQLDEIEKRINEAKAINRTICAYIGTTPLEEMTEDEENIS